MEKSINKIWYEKTYNSLVETRKSRGLDKTKLDYYTEKHHIIPKCMGGKDEDDNYVLLTFREHIIAHKLLTRIYPDIPGLYLSVSLMLSTDISIDGKKISSKNFSNTKEAEKWKLKGLELLSKNGGRVVSEESRSKMSKSASKKFQSLSEEDRKRIYGKSGKDHKNFGKHLSDTTKEKIRNSQLGKSRPPVSETTRAKMSESHKNIPKTDSWKRNLSNSLKGRVITKEQSDKRLKTILDKNGGIFPKRTEEQKRKTSETLIKNRLNNKSLKKVMSPDGTIYSSLKDCSEAIGKDRHTISKWIKNKPEKGFKFI